MASRWPWVGLGAAVWMQIAAGNPYTFPLYSHSLKSDFNQTVQTQSQLARLGLATDIGENFGILPGLFSNMVDPWVLLLIGAVACSFGYGFVCKWVAHIGTDLPVPYWKLWMTLCVATNSSAWFTTAVLVTNMRNFPMSRGTVSGILKGYGGLSAALYAIVYICLQSSYTNLLLFLAVGIPMVCFLSMYLVRPCSPASGHDSLRDKFFFVQGASVALGLCVLIATTLDCMHLLSVRVASGFLFVMVVLLLAPFAIPVKMTFYPTESAVHQAEPLLEPSSTSPAEVLPAEGEGALNENFTLRKVVARINFWLLFLAYFFGVGTGVTVLNNLAQIGRALNLNDIRGLLSAFSICNFLGRLCGGSVSDYLFRLKPRTIWMAITQAIMAVTYLLFAWDFVGTLYVPISLLGICYGFQFSIMVSTISEVFGLRLFGMIFNLMSLANPLGAYLFSSLLAGSVYDRATAKQHSSTCSGTDCFWLTFVVLAGACVVGTVLSLILTRRLEPVYRVLHARGSIRLPQSSEHRE